MSKLGFCPLAGHSPGRLLGLLTGHNTLRRHFDLLGLSDSLLCRSGAEDETLVHILSECTASVSL